MEEEFNIPCIDAEIKLPSLISSFAYLLDYGFQSLGLYNKEIHVLSEMNKTIACSIKKAENELGYLPTFDLYQGTKFTFSSLV